MCRDNVGRDIEGSTKLIQILMMMCLALTDFAMGSISFGSSYKHIWTDGFFWAGIATDIALSFVFRVIAYSYLSSQWEGYQGRKCL